MSSNCLRLRVLGGLRVEAGGNRLAGAAAQRKSLALLALLSTAREAGVSRDTIGAYLWPEAEASKVSHRLNQLLYALRRALSREDLFLGSVDLRLNPDAVASDVAEFLDALDTGSLDDATSIYTGPFLEGFHLDDAPEFERWVDGQRADLARQYLAVLQELFARAVARGDVEGAVEWSRRLFELDKLDTDSTLRLMQALRAAGSTTKALQVASEHEGAVNRELGTDADPKVGRLAELIRDGAGPADSTDSGLARPPVSEHPLESRQNSPEASHPSLGPPLLSAPHNHGAKLRVAKGVAMLLGAAAIVTVSLSHRVPPSHSNRVLVTTFENRTGDSTLNPLGPIASDWLSRGLSETGLLEVLDPSVSVSLGASPERTSHAWALATRTGAGAVVFGSYFVQGDSVYFEAKVVDVAAKTVLTAVPPAAAPSRRPLDAVDALRHRVMVALAFRFDPRLRDLPATSEPPTYEGYRHFVEGMALHMKGDLQGAIREMTLAEAGDSSFPAPLITMAADHFYLGEYAAAESLVGRLGREREHLTPLEGYTLRWLEAKLVGENMQALEMSRAWAHLAPGTSLQLSAALDALVVNRPHEALALLKNIDPNQGTVGQSVLYWWALTMTHHLLGDHERELAAAKRARTLHDNWDTMFLELRALAALGRNAELEQLLDETASTSRGQLWDPELALILVGQDARAHGYAETGQAVLERAVAWCRAHPDGAGQWRLAVALYLAADWQAAGRIAGRATASDTTGWAFRGLMGRVAARRGDTTTAEQILQQLEAVRKPYEFGGVTMARAEIMSLLGRRDQAVALVRQSLAEGFPFPFEVHIDADFEPLRGYEPYEDQIRPRD